MSTAIFAFVASSTAAAMSSYWSVPENP